ncbi:MAG: DUF4301 family protein [Bacteroidia bacterium]|nr:DUF4301 family protein [Bacteroidia bacterium]
MFTNKDIQQIENRGSSLPEIEKQIAHFKKGFPYLKVLRPATIGDGIIRLDEERVSAAVKQFTQKVHRGLKPVKFVPASGAASRMFQSLFAFAEAADTSEKAIELLGESKYKSVKQFFDRITDFAFYNKLVDALVDIKTPGGDLKYCEIVNYVLSDKGLNYRFLPKGLLDFHLYNNDSRTPVEEHMIEGALYGADSQGNVKLHFTVSPEHLSFFEKKTTQAAQLFEPKFGVKYDINFSVQKPSTDTIAVDPENNPFRLADDRLFFRPAGHGALLDNLNEIDADILFVKNIDNVVPDRLKNETVRYKMALALLLSEYQERIFSYLNLLEKSSDHISDKQIAEMVEFTEKELCTEPYEDQYYADKSSLVHYLFRKLNRPIRVCGMVKNEGEPGGGPFWAKNADGTVSLQVVESSQIDSNDPEQNGIAHRSTHFNPVDLVCGVRNFKGEKFDLLKYRDPETGFISLKSKDGKPLKAQELPGLWNGAMADWITLFVEVPVITFNPVKMVNDLLRSEHQPL